MSDDGKGIGPIVHRPGCEKADVRAHCACGANRSCSTCGWGNGAYPCECNRIAALTRAALQPPRSACAGAGTPGGETT